MRETPTNAHLMSCCLTDGGSVSTLRISCYPQKARKQGLLGLSASPQYIKNRLEKPAFRVKIPRETDFLPLGEKPGLLHVAELPEKGGVKWLT